MSLRDQLVAEYLAFKFDLKLGRRKADLSDMTDREQAGLWLKIGDSNALVLYDDAMRSM